jgi:hypothetical protein
MIRQKSFQQIGSLVAWFNRGEHHDCRLIGALTQGKEIVAIYEVPDGSSDLSPEDRRRAILEEKLTLHLDHPEETKRALKYPKEILPYRVVPYSRLHNSLRNLKPFGDMNNEALAYWIKQQLPILGHRLLTRSEAKIEYQTNAILIE